ncbi:MAG: hypothetical protein OQK42_01370, partial [Sedimenticola sp.]|nr:hypothetical protein [Sedimenticola sp.]
MNSTMGIFIKRRFILLVGVSLLLLSQGVAAEEKFRVVTSIKPIHSILASLMLGTEGPELLLEKDAIPFGYQLSEQQKKQVADASMIVWVGPEL